MRPCNFEHLGCLRNHPSFIKVKSFQSNPLSYLSFSNFSEALESIELTGKVSQSRSTLNESKRVFDIMQSMVRFVEIKSMTGVIDEKRRSIKTLIIFILQQMQ